MPMLQTPPYTRLSGYHPVIVVGMHRSGTSLLCRLLDQLGVHLGADQGPINAESRHFRALNERVLHAAGGRWNEPAPVLAALESADFRQTWMAHLRNHMLSGWGGLRYWGRNLWLALRQGAAPPPWGWKDPRTSLTLVLWLGIFPQAHVVHIIRNGIDVAISLYRRQLAQTRRWRVHPDHRDPRGYDFRFCFSLWVHYQQHLLAFRDVVAPDRYFEFRYEILLREPETTLRALAGQIGLSVSDNHLAEVAAMINPGRLDNRTHAQSYREFIPELTAHPLMQALGYDDYPL
ncbi:MAG: hypothetical protein Kow00106_01970 [Anaerolineae bacterium]